MGKNRGKSPIVVFGGMGPQASVMMYDLLVKMAAEHFGARDTDEFPEIIVDSIPVPDFIERTDQKTILIKMIKQRMKTLMAFNPLCFSFACNTVHLFMKDFNGAAKRPIISMIDEVVVRVRRGGYGSVGILGSPLTIASRLYEIKFMRENIKVIIPNKNQMNRLDSVIRNVIAGKFRKVDVFDLIKIANSLVKKGAQSIILGCTEVPLIFPEKFAVPIYDSLKVLAMKLLKLYYQRN